MKDRAAREREDESKGRGGRQTIPLSLLHLSLPSHPPPVLQAVRKNHACEACGKAFRDVYHLNRHRLSHSDEKPYHCPICQQRFKRKDRMSYHVRSHQGGVEKPYVCPHCAKGFSRPDHLNSHVRQVHSTERPFKCPTCTSAFATRDRLRAHLIRHEEKVPCHICGKLLSAAYITDHMRVHNQSQHHACHLCNRSEWTSMLFFKCVKGEENTCRTGCGSGMKFPLSTDVGSASPPPILTLTISGETEKLTQDQHIGAFTLQWMSMYVMKAKVCGKPGSLCI
uniref:Myc-associated zinc finger protein-like n=1 Tax=Salmo trutta TaxID=8032 RepID=A0A674CE13_SALTR